MMLLNIGCGLNYHQDWENIDIQPRGAEVRKVDINAGLPYLNATAEFCYSSHVLEHLDCEKAKSLLAECNRVLRPGGILRVVVPDLENIARSYLNALELAISGEKNSEEQYQWIKLELLDQMTRDVSGGKMIQYLATMKESQKNFVIGRIGNEALQYINSFENRSPITLKKILIALKDSLKNIRKKIAGFITFVVAGRSAYKNYLVGEFRASGEVHRWMYDKYSLQKMLNEAGFKIVQRFSANESNLENFSSYGLESRDGFELKPDSLYMEAIKF
jgi:predicted SAM-dependent methyltransferase